METINGWERTRDVDTINELHKDLLLAAYDHFEEEPFTRRVGRDFSGKWAVKDLGIQRGERIAAQTNFPRMLYLKGYLERRIEEGRKKFEYRCIPGRIEYLKISSQSYVP